MHHNAHTVKETYKRKLTLITSLFYEWKRKESKRNEKRKEGWS